MLRRCTVAATIVLAELVDSRSTSCDEHCVCDGVDLSALADGATFDMPEIVDGPHSEGPDDWMYRISVCDPLPREQIPSGCLTGIGHPWHAPHIVRFKRGDYSQNTTNPTHGDCHRVGSDVVLAQATHHDLDPITNTSTESGVQLIFTAEDGGQTHTVTANLICDRTVGDMPPSAVRFQHFGANPATAVETYEFDWITEAACPPPPPPPCVGCVCAGVDLSLLQDTYDATGFSLLDNSYQSCELSNENCSMKIDGWQYKVDVCGTINQDELPAECVDVDTWSAQVAQFAVKDNVHVQQSGCQPVGTAVTAAERTEHGVRLTWQDTQTQGLRTKVQGEFICLEDGVGKIDRMEAQEKHAGTRNELTEYTFEMETMAACSPNPPTPAPPSYAPDICDSQCVCDGQDVSHLRGTVTLLDADLTKKWVYKLAVCEAVSRAGLPPSCALVPANATALRYQTESDTGMEPLCEQIGSASVKATHTVNKAGAIDGVDLIYSFESDQCRGGCEVQLKVQCSRADAAAARPSAMLDLSQQGDLNGGSEYFSRWVAQCGPSAPPPPEPSSHTLLIVLLLVAALAVLGGAAAFVVVKRRRAASAEGGELDDRLMPESAKTSW